MPLLAILAIIEALATASTTTKPVLAGRDNCRFLGPLQLEVERAGSTGGGTVYGANLPGAAAGDTKYCRQLGSDGATGRTVFTTTIPYAAFSNYNFVVLQNGAIVEQGAGAGKFQVSNSGGFAVITLGTAAAVGDTIETHLVTPVSLLTFATATTIFKKTEVQGYDIMWYVSDATGTPSSTNVYAEVIGE